MKIVSVITALCFLALSVSPLTAGEWDINGSFDGHEKEITIGYGVQFGAGKSLPANGLGQPQPEFANLTSGEDKPMYKKPWFIITALLVVVAVIVGENNDWGDSGGDNRGNDTVSLNDDSDSVGGILSGNRINADNGGIVSVDVYIANGSAAAVAPLEE